jgi:hypothetical protein
MAEIFVFGSNLAGRHGAGSALEAVINHGAIYGKPYGPQGNSFAIPTKDAKLQTLSLERIEPFVQGFLYYANRHSELTFKVVAIGCGLAGYKPEQIAPMFDSAPSNVILPLEFAR